MTGDLNQGSAARVRRGLPMNRMDVPKDNRGAEDRRSVDMVVPEQLKAGPLDSKGPSSDASGAQKRPLVEQKQAGPLKPQHKDQGGLADKSWNTASAGEPTHHKHLVPDIWTSQADANATPAKDEVAAGSIIGRGDYFNSEAVSQYTVRSSEPSIAMTPGISRDARSTSPNITTVLQDSPNQPSTNRKHASPPPQDSAGEVTTARPTSVPAFLNSSFGRSREGQDNAPRYPDQTFSTFAPPQYGPPPTTRIGRTRSSHSPNWSVASSSEHPADNLERNHSGSKTVGGTPAQSPGVYTPSPRSPILSSRKRAPDSDDGRPSSQILQHTTHSQPPIETHHLIKERHPISGNKILNNYELRTTKLGSGQHGTVKKGWNLETGEPVAVKIVRRFSKKLRLGKSGDPNDMIKKEVAILKKARHPHVVSLFEVIDDPEVEKVYLVLEYVERGEIVWRKGTSKAIARFEKDRLERERTPGFNEAMETEIIAKFNENVVARRLEQVKILDEQKRQARERLELGNRPSQLTGTDPFWSFRYGEHDEHDHLAPIRQEHVPNDDRWSRADIHAAENAGESPTSSTPVYSPQGIPQPQPFDTDFSAPPQSSSHISETSSKASTRPASPTRTSPLEGTMYGPYIERKTKSDLEFEQALQQIIYEQSERWSVEEESWRYVPCLTLSQALDAFRDTVLGLEYLHYQGIIHRDIKPANLLWTNDYRVKISDFGVSYLGKPIREDSNHEELSEADTGNLDEALELAKTVGTPAFYAPELCDMEYLDTDKHPERPAITGQIDVWALGVTLYGMVFGRLPFFHHNEFMMYEKIAREEVFIPRLRLRGVLHTNEMDKTPSDHSKRADDTLEYEEVDDTLRDLLKRLLAKHPRQRISLKEVKHHPWVVSGIENKDHWLDETDPSRHSEGKKIEVSNQEVQDAVVGLTVTDYIKRSVQKIGSVFRGGGRSRKRAESNPKQAESSYMSKARDDRRSSLRGDEQIVAALKQSQYFREGSEHPLAQSVAASPDFKPVTSYFANDPPDARPQSAMDPMSSASNTMSTDDSMKTVTARDPPPVRPSVLPSQQSSTEDIASTTATADANNSSSSSLGGIFSRARQLTNTLRSRERGSHSSRESSVDANNNTSDDYHASPSLGLSSAIAAGHVDLPPALREETEGYSLPTESSADSLQQARRMRPRRSVAEFARSIGGHRRSISYAAGATDPNFPHHETGPPYQQRPASAADSSFAISSSSDQIVSGESTTHSRIPSEVSGASSLSGTTEDPFQPRLHPLEKSISPLTIGRKSTERPRSEPVEPALLRTQQEEEAGYAGEGEFDSDSDDEGLAMA